MSFNFENDSSNVESHWQRQRQHVGSTDITECRWQSMIVNEQLSIFEDGWPRWQHRTKAWAKWQGSDLSGVWPPIAEGPSDCWGPSVCWGPLRLTRPLRLSGSFRLLRAPQIAGASRISGAPQIAGGASDGWGPSDWWGLSDCRGPSRLVRAPQIAGAPGIAGAPQLVGALVHCTPCTTHCYATVAMGPNKDHGRGSWILVKWTSYNIHRTEHLNSHNCEWPIFFFWISWLAKKVLASKMRPP